MKLSPSLTTGICRFSMLLHFNQKTTNAISLIKHRLLVLGPMQSQRWDENTFNLFLLTLLSPSKFILKQDFLFTLCQSSELKLLAVVVWVCVRNILGLVFLHLLSLHSQSVKCSVEREERQKF